MVAGPNELDLKKFQMRVKFKICFKFGLKIKKKSRWGWARLGNGILPYTGFGDAGGPFLCSVPYFP
jgi:hypothetical protein